jgi:ABC-type Fe3+ transport system substrate-binding protein
MIFRRFLTALVVGCLPMYVVGVPAHVSAQTSPAFTEPKNLDELVAGARREGQLNIAWGPIYGGADGIKQLQDHINKRYHLNLAITFSPVANGAAFANQIRQEVSAGQPPSTDVLFNAYSPEFAQPLASVDWRKYVPGLPAGVMYFDNRVVEMVTVINAIAYNTKLVPPNKVPTSVYDLLKPEWRGKIATPSYEGYESSFLGLNQAMGRDRTLDYFKQFAKQVGGIMGCGNLGRVASGEFTFFAIDCGDWEARMQERAGAPVGEAYPKEGVALNFFAPGVLRTAVHPYAARLLIAFMLTREGQDLLWDVMGTDNYKLRGSHVAAILDQQRRKGVKLIDTFGQTVAHPELVDYENQIDQMVRDAH